LYEETYYVILAVLIVLLICLGIYYQHRKKKERAQKTEEHTARGTRIKSDIIGDKAGVIKADAPKTKPPAPAVRTEEPAKAKGTKAKAVKTSEDKKESLPRVIYKYFPFALKEEGEIWVCGCCEVENSSDYKACILCGKSRSDD
jgi:hypothetical protein